MCDASMGCARAAKIHVPVLKQSLKGFVSRSCCSILHSSLPDSQADQAQSWYSRSTMAGQDLKAEPESYTTYHRWSDYRGQPQARLYALPLLADRREILRHDPLLDPEIKAPIFRPHYQTHVRRLSLSLSWDPGRSQPPEAQGSLTGVLLHCRSKMRNADDAHYFHVTRIRTVSSRPSPARRGMGRSIMLLSFANRVFWVSSTLVSRWGLAV